MNRHDPELSTYNQQPAALVTLVTPMTDDSGDSSDCNNSMVRSRTCTRTPLTHMSSSDGYRTRLIRKDSFYTITPCPVLSAPSPDPPPPFANSSATVPLASILFLVSISVSKIRWPENSESRVVKA